MAYSVIKKELSTYISRKYPWTCPNNKTESTIFFLFAVVFLQPFCSLSLSLSLFFFYIMFFFCPLFFSSFFVLYIMAFFTISFIHVWSRWWKSFFFCFSPLFLNLPFLAVRLRVHCLGITSTLMRPEG